MRIAMGIEYEGANYAGFQRQKHAPSVQGCLEQALSIIADEQIQLQCAGRTDAHVNATGQVIHFDVKKPRNERNWLLGTNTKLPQDIAVNWVRQVDDSFHARFSATSRRYRYIIQNTVHRAGILSKGVAFYHGSYDLEAMYEAAQLLKGEQDFSSFAGAEEESRSHMRCVHFVEIKRYGPYIVFDIAANAFLNHMVRNIVGSLLLVGEGSKDKAWFARVLKACDRQQAGPTAKAQGLYLVAVTYPQHFNLPYPQFLGPLWLP